MAAYLDLLSEEYGLSEHREDLLEKRARRPTSFRPFVRHYLADDPGAVDAERLRDKLYAVFAELADLVESGGINELSRPALTATSLLATAQIYWAISWDNKTRPGLPFRSGRNVSGRDRQGRLTSYKAVIWTDAKEKDLAALRRTERADSVSGMGETSGSALRARGAHLAVLAAHHIITSAHDDPPPLDGVRFDLAPDRKRGQRLASIYWEGQVRASGGDSGAHAGDAIRSAPSANSFVRGLEQLGNQAQAAGSLSEAAFLRSTIVKILQERSESAPGDHEGELAAARLQAGLSCVTAGRPNEALEHFSSAERSSLLLSDLMPTDSTHQVRIASAQTMIGLIHLQSGRNDEAEPALTRAVKVAQQLTDQSADNEDMLAMALTLLGVLHLQSGRADDAESTLARAITISEKLAKRKADGHERDLILLGLTMLGILYLGSHRLRDAEEVLNRATAISGQVVRENPADKANRLLLTNGLVVLGSLYLASDRMEDAEGALTTAIGKLAEVAEVDADDTMQLLEAGAHFSLGTIYLLTDRADEAEPALIRAAAIGKRLADRKPDDWAQRPTLENVNTVIGGALYFLGAIYLSNGREEDAEEALTGAVGALVQTQDSSILLGNALQTLAELHREQGRDQDAKSLVDPSPHLDNLSSDDPPAA